MDGRYAPAVVVDPAPKRCATGSIGERREDSAVERGSMRVPDKLWSERDHQSDGAALGPNEADA